MRNSASSRSRRVRGVGSGIGIPKLGFHPLTHADQVSTSKIADSARVRFCQMTWLSGNLVTETRQPRCVGSPRRDTLLAACPMATRFAGREPTWTCTGDATSAPNVLSTSRGKPQNTALWPWLAVTRALTTARRGGTPSRLARRKLRAPLSTWSANRFSALE